MKLPPWAVAVVVQLLSLAGLTSASTGDQALMIGLALSNVSPSGTSSQPRVSLDLDFFVQIPNHQLKVPIMPLHLLGKKSWNVYNQDNIAKVKRDEASARAIEEAEEQRMQEVDAERRIQILRGEVPTSIPEIDQKFDDDALKTRSRDPGRERKRGKKAGENDTDFEMRLANEQSQSSSADKQIVLRKSMSDAPILDHSGHIDLFPQDHSRKPVEKNAEAEKEAAKKKKEYEDQYTMRFSNAAGFKQELENPWYAARTDSAAAVEDGGPGKDVWGNEDPRRKEREAARIVSNDPLAAMRQGAAKVRQVEMERARWREEKEKELRDFVVSEERMKRKRGYNDEDDETSLEDFKLDMPERVLSRSSRSRGHDHSRETSHRHKESRRSSHREESSRHRHRHRHRHRD